MDWQPIVTAPKDRPIWVFYDHDADPYFDGESKLTPYGAACEAGVCKHGKGQCAAEWADDYKEDVSSDGWGPRHTVPGWWFEEGSNFEIAVNPTHWMEKPADPPIGTNPSQRVGMTPITLAIQWDD